MTLGLMDAPTRERFEQICAAVKGTSGRGISLSEIADARGLAEAEMEDEPDPERVEELRARLGLYVAGRTS